MHPALIPDLPVHTRIHQPQPLFQSIILGGLCAMRIEPDYAYIAVRSGCRQSVQVIPHGIPDKPRTDPAAGQAEGMYKNTVSTVPPVRFRRRWRVNRKFSRNLSMWRAIWHWPERLIRELAAIQGDSWLISIFSATFAPPSGVGTNAKAGFLRRISGISRDVGDARFGAGARTDHFVCVQGCQCARIWVRWTAFRKCPCPRDAKVRVRQRGTVVFCDGVIVGEFTAGLLVEDQVIVDLKVAAAPSNVHRP